MGLGFANGNDGGYGDSIFGNFNRLEVDNQNSFITIVGTSNYVQNELAASHAFGAVLDCRSRGATVIGSSNVTQSFTSAAQRPRFTVGIGGFNSSDFPGFDSGITRRDGLNIYDDGLVVANENSIAVINAASSHAFAPTPGRALVTKEWVESITGSLGGSTDTGSLLTTASVNLNEITFTKGDSSTFIITVDTGSAVTSVFETGSIEPSIQTVYGTNTARASYSVVLGGNANDTTGEYSNIVGGLTNVISGEKSGISAGELNTIDSNFSFIGAGLQNTGSGEYSVIGGGIENQTLGSGSFIGGGGNLGGKYSGNTASGLVSTIAGGGTNTASGDESTVGGGYNNQAKGLAATIAGGSANTATGSYSTIAGGSTNIASGSYSGILAGATNTARGQYSGILAGLSNSIQGGGIRSAIIGGRDNEILASGSVILGGSNNDITANGNFSSVIAGNQITADREITAFAGSVYVTGSTSVPSSSFAAVLQVARRESTPATPEEGMIINSGSAGNSDLWFYKGSVGGWVKLTPTI